MRSGDDVLRVANGLTVENLHIEIRLRNFEAICRMVGQGVGVGVVPRSSAVYCRRAAGVRALQLDDV